MAGTIGGLSLSQVMDSSGRPLSGAKLYLYEANTTNPVTCYRDVANTPGQEHPWPLVADSRGRIPSFWLPIGTYHARLTDADDAVQFDEEALETLYAGSAEEEYHEGFETGDIKFRLGEEAIEGWVKLNGQTLGNAGSGAAVEGAEYQDLYAYFYNTFDDTLCPVGGGRVTLEFDWGAGKTLGMRDLRGCGIVGLDDMGAAPANRLTAFSFSPGDAVTGGSLGGFLAAGSPGLGFLVGTWYIRI